MLILAVAYKKIKHKILYRGSIFAAKIKQLEGLGNSDFSNPLFFDKIILVKTNFSNKTFEV